MASETTPMIDDIVNEVLRDWTAFKENACERYFERERTGYTERERRIARLLHSAPLLAHEVQRLQSQMERLAAERVSLHNECDEVDAENKRLREALEKFRYWHHNLEELESIGMAQARYDGAIAAADAALKPQPETET